ncbi:MAG: hypothetical protein ACLU4J_01775 [Butyricimonas paravirosa]
MVQDYVNQRHQVLTMPDGSKPSLAETPNSCGSVKRKRTSRSPAYHDARPFLLRIKVEVCFGKTSWSENH